MKGLGAGNVEVKVEADHLTFHEKPGSHLQARPCGRSWHRARTLQNSLQATKVWGRLSSLSLLRQASLKKTGARDINAAIQPIHKLQAEAPRDRLGKLGRLHRRLHPQSFAQIVAVLDGVTVEEAVCGLCGAKIKAHRAVPDQALRDAIFGAQSSEINPYCTRNCEDEILPRLPLPHCRICGTQAACSGHRTATSKVAAVRRQ